MKYRRVVFTTLMFSICVRLQAVDRAPNPFITHMFTADPSAHVWNDGRLYVYPSTDIKGMGYGKMDGYHVFSTDDMVSWIDHGEILNASQVPWGREAGGFMWAPDCAYKNGIYYFYFPHPSGKKYKTTWKIGVATSSCPSSGFEEQGYIKGLKPMIDPCVFIDDDGQAYLFYGGPGQPHGVKLKENMMEIDGKLKFLEGLEDFKEGLWIFKRKGMYYAIYPDTTKPTNEMRYAMSQTPLGPYTYKGILMEGLDVITTHGSIVEYKGQWYIFYHNGALSGGKASNRSICFDNVFFNEDGTMQKVIPTLGVDHEPAMLPLRQVNRNPK